MKVARAAKVMKTKMAQAIQLDTEPLLCQAMTREILEATRVAFLRYNVKTKRRDWEALY